MSLLQALRDAQAIVRWTLACFVLSMGVAVASPLVQPQTLTLVCSATGSMLLEAAAPGDGDAGSPQQARHTLDCVLCFTASAPPQAPVPVPLAAAGTQPRPFSAWALPTWRTSEPTSARDPPLLS